MSEPVTSCAPTLETSRLILRGWRVEDIEPYAAMLADPATARFITRRGRPYGSAEAWAETALFGEACEIWRLEPPAGTAKGS